MNKKANFADIVVYIEWVLVFTFVAGIVIMFVSNFNTNIQAMSTDTIPNTSKTISANYYSFLPSAIDYLFVLASMMFFIISVVSARLIPSSSKFMIIGVIALILLPFGAMIVTDVWSSWVAQSPIASGYALMTFMPFILNHLVYFVLAYSLAVGIAMYTKEE